VATAASLVFFGCVLLHELAHSLVALHYRVRVRSITLFLFGGVSNIEQEPPSARAELLIAIVGPLTSIVLGVIAVVLSALAMPPISDADSAVNALAQLGPVGTLLVWLGPINVVIGLFNMIPGFPLDGGRVLRSILWGISGNFRSATTWAAGTGQVIGWLLIGCGIAMSFGAQLPVFGTGLASGLWLAFIGWFLRSAASNASTRVALDDALAGLTVEQLMRRHGSVATPEISVTRLVHGLLVPGDDRALPVVRGDGALLGLVSISDVRHVPPDQWPSTPVSAVMRGVDELQVAAPDQPLAKAFEQLAMRDIEQMPVVADGQLVGMLRRRDVARWLELAWRPSADSSQAVHPGRTAHHPL